MRQIPAKIAINSLYKLASVRLMHMVQHPRLY